MHAPSVTKDLSPLQRFKSAEERGLKLAILCRTVIAASLLVYLLVVVSVVSEYSTRIWSIAVLVAFIVSGVAHLCVIGTRFDRWWLKYVIYAFDVISICALFAIIPVSRSDSVPQILAFRAYGIYYLFPIVALSALALSWQLVVWTGLVVVSAWWAVFIWVVSAMDHTLSWSDIPPNATLADYENTFLSIDFIGVGNRVEETGLLFCAALVLALVVYRAREVFFAQIAAEAREQFERQSREKVTEALGRFVPESVTDQIIADSGALAPKESYGSILVLDIADFTGFASRQTPIEVIEKLDVFLAHCSNVIAKKAGVIISFTGDGLLASFNTPLVVPHPEQAAASAGQRLVNSASSFGFNIRIGIASGAIASGCVGSEKHKAFTVYGTTVNRAARLESMCKEFAVSIVIDATTRNALTEGIDAKALGKQQIRGLSDMIPIYSIAP